MNARNAWSALVCMLGVMTASAQHTGVRWIFPEFNKLIQRPLFSSMQAGMGVDRDLNERLSIGLDCVFDLQGALASEGFGWDLNTQNGGQSAWYTYSHKIFGLMYRASYALGDNEFTHTYIGSYIGFRRLGESALYNYGSSYDQSSFVSSSKGSRTIIPIGLRFGLRGSLEGGYADVYLAAGLNLGGKESSFQQSYLHVKDLEASPVALTVGVAYGIGW